MNPKSKSFAWLAAIASVIGILTPIPVFLSWVGFASGFDFLKTKIPLPFWSIPLLVALLMVMVVRAVDRATKVLVDKADNSERNLQKATKENEALSLRLAAVDLKEIGRLQTRSEQLFNYESLEQEIKGLLRSGREMTLSEIIDQTSTPLTPDRVARTTRALAALGNQIDGNNGKYRLSRSGEDAEHIVGRERR